ncbi:MAG: metal ABC transporter permease [Candidatus Omnitrophica bacterium]|nr:metal ABC transporter permease [Candidatus Omnitrophota bacterium]
MWKPFLAAVVLTGIHGYLGIHVVERQIIFVDLALAQIAALGATAAYLFGFDLHSPATYWFSLGATFLGAVIFSTTRSRNERVPQEAVIGIVYAVSAAAAVLILSRSAEGDEHIRYMLVGNILLVGGPEILKMALLYGAVGLFHWIFRKTFLLISSRPEEAFAKGIRVRVWDLLFYLTFGLVVTSSVQIAGVLLVFSYLIVPAVAAILFARRLSSRLFLGWGLGAGTSLAGLACSYWLDLPTGAAIVCAFGVVLAALTVMRRAVR